MRESVPIALGFLRTCLDSQTPAGIAPLPSADSHPPPHRSGVSGRRASGAFALTFD